MKLIDTHCHIHEAHFYEADRESIFERAIAADTAMICIGTSEQHSREALAFASNHKSTWATIGVHPHDTSEGWQVIGELIKAGHEKLVGIGEIGLDYFYDNSPRDTQINALEEQLQWASTYNLPVSFHVREAFDDFWPIFDNFASIRGVLHSFTDNETNLERGLSRGLYIGINGISTFARDKQALYDSIPLDKMVLETDAPFLTPVPHRGKVNEPAFVRHVAEYHANKRAVELEHLARVTSANASTLFSLGK